MLNIVDNFSKEYDVTFNHKKSKLLLYETNENEFVNKNDTIVFDNSIIHSVEEDKHLGNIIGKNVKNKKILSGISNFYGRMNMLIAQFKNAFPWIKYTLFKYFCIFLL